MENRQTGQPIKLTKSEIAPVEAAEEHDLLARAHEGRVPEIDLVHAGGGGEGGLEAVDEQQELVLTAQPGASAPGESPDGPQ